VVERKALKAESRELVSKIAATEEKQEANGFFPSQKISKQRS